MQLLAIALGGALGSVLRYWVSSGMNHWLGRSYPYGTLTVNVLGSFLMGVLFVIFSDRLDPDSPWRALLLVGFLGAFTTFSTFSLETVSLLEKGSLFKASVNMISSVALCVAAAWLGLLLARMD